ncbi:MAG: GNAT family N-acetyltransferase [Bacilli bacterium]|jgi:GNAT superfamily N-acetyltransferase
MKIVSIHDKNNYPSFKTFDCGIRELNEFLFRFANQNDEKGIGKTFLAIDGDEVVGYFTLATAEVTFDLIPDELLSSLPKYPIPVIRIARLAVGKTHQHNGVGKFLLKEALLKILFASQSVGIYAIIVDAKESSVEFYKKFGFIPLKNNEKTLFIVLETIKRALLIK